MFEGLFAVLTSDKRFIAQEFAGRLLLEVAPSCPRTDLDAVLEALLPVWELSVEQVPWYFEQEFGTDDLHEAIRRAAERGLTPDEKCALRSFGYWVRYPVAELPDGSGGRPPV